MKYTRRRRRRRRRRRYRKILRLISSVFTYNNNNNNTDWRNPRNAADVLGARVIIHSGSSPGAHPFLMCVAYTFRRGADRGRSATLPARRHRNRTLARASCKGVYRTGNAAITRRRRLSHTHDVCTLYTRHLETCDSNNAHASPRCRSSIQLFIRKRFPTQVFPTYKTYLLIILPYEILSWKCVWNNIVLYYTYDKTLYTSVVDSSIIIYDK